MINYKPVEKLHESENSVIIKVIAGKKDKFYVMKLYKGINNAFQRLIFKREMEALRKLNTCDGIVRIRDTSTSVTFNGNNNYGTILMDHVTGKTLDKLDWCDFSQLKKYEICLKVLKSIYNAHSNDVIHRDLKPSNIIYDDIKNDITIIDFGSSKIKTIVEKETTMPLYSENYSAPEVIAGKDVTEASDIYSLGVIFYEMFFLNSSSSLENVIQEVRNSSYKDKFKEIIIAMLQSEPEKRPQQVLDIIDVFSDLIGELNTSSFEFNIFIDNEKLQLLKRKMLIENSMNMSIFTNSFLKKEFTERYGYYDLRKDVYVITGMNLVIECSINKETKSIEVVYINEISIDRKNINIKRSFKFEGKLLFIDRRFKGVTPISQDNAKLITMFINRLDETDNYRKKEEQFEKLFGEWQKGLDESVMSEKDKVSKIIYNNYTIEGNQLALEVEHCENKSVDEVLPNTKFVVEGKNKRNQPVYYDIGVFEEVICDDDNVKMIFNVPKKFLPANVKSLLKNKAPVMEDFRANISSYSRQFKAINLLRADDCSAKNLKDIILSLEEPDEIPTISKPRFIAKDLNNSQQQAVIKALNSENISLIQGPPGTGKTKVIKEIIGQIISKSKFSEEVPKILIVSQSHTAVDNILEGLQQLINVDKLVIRIGSEKNVSKIIATKYTLDAHREITFNKIKENIKEFRKHNDLIYSSITDEIEKERWNRIKEIQDDWIKRSGEMDCFDYQMVRSATVIAGTCIGFLSNEYIKDMEFDYVIIDEAAKATTPELLVSIIRAKRMILVGDQNQLPAFADERISPIISRLTKNPEFRLFDMLFNNLPGTHKQILTTQYRMIENIGNLISTVFYGGKIDTGIDDKDRLHGLKRYDGKSIIWFDTSKNKNRSQKKTRGESYINEEEKRVIQCIFDDLSETDELKGLNIGIITGYSGQKDLLRKTIKAREFDQEAIIDINTLDAFQGRENDIIIYSTVRTTDSIGFLKEKERVNVAFSRARKLLIICGDMDFFYNFDDPQNKFIEIIDYIKNHEKCQVISCWEDKIF